MVPRLLHQHLSVTEQACRGCDLNIPYNDSFTSDPGPDFSVIFPQPAEDEFL